MELQKKKKKERKKSKGTDCLLENAPSKKTNSTKQKNSHSIGQVLSV
jgi:hypothetical protein